MKKKKSSTKQKLEKKKDSDVKQISQTPESRRKFLKKVWAGLGILAGVEFAAVIFGFLFSGKGNKNVYVPKQMIEAGTCEFISTKYCYCFQRRKILSNKT